MKHELVFLLGKGRKFLAIEKLVTYCEDELPDSEITATSGETLSEYNHNMRLWDAGRDDMKVLNDAAFQAIKILILTSSATAAALLAFLGAIWPTVNQGFSSALSFLGVAAFGGVVAYGLVYVFLLFSLELKWWWAAKVLRIITILLVVVCYCSLFAGLLMTSSAITGEVESDQSSEQDVPAKSDRAGG